MKLNWNDAEKIYHCEQTKRKRVLSLKVPEALVSQVDGATEKFTIG